MYMYIYIHVYINASVAHRFTRRSSLTGGSSGRFTAPSPIGGGSGGVSIASSSSPPSGISDGRGAVRNMVGDRPLGGEELGE